MKYFTTENRNGYLVGYRKIGTCVFVAEILLDGIVEIELSADNMQYLRASVDNYFKFNF